MLIREKSNDDHKRYYILRLKFKKSNKSYSTQL